MYIEFKAGRRSLLMDERLFALLLLPLTFTLVTGLFFKFTFLSLVWASVYAISALWFTLDYRVTFGLMWKWRVLFVLPGIAFLSAVWSTQPAETLTAATQFFFSTLLAMRLAAALETTTIIAGLLFATMLGVVLSLASPFVGAFQPIYENNGAFIGIYVQKTVAGVSFALAALSLVCVGPNRKYLFMRALIALAMAPLIIAASSVSALIVFAFVPVVIFLKLIAHKSTTFHVATLLGILLFVVALITVIWLDGLDITAVALEAVGKSPTLTGRTDIWAVGMEVWQDYPLIGTGYAAFWQNPQFSELVGYLHATIDPRLKGFHNMFVEALATTGLLGLIAVLFVYGWTFLRCFLWHVSTGTSDAIFWVVIVMIGLAFSLTDNALFAEHEKFHILLSMAYVFAAQRPVIRLMAPK